jgi:hypothetical protein
MNAAKWFGHCLEIMGHKNTTLLSSACQHFWISHPTKTRSFGRLEIHRGFTAANRTNNDLVQIRIGLKSQHQAWVSWRCCLISAIL